MRTGKQPFDESRVGVGRIISQEFGRFCGGWRQSDQIERHATQQRQLVGRYGEPQSILLKSCEDKRINFILRLGTCGWSDGGDAGAPDRLECPMVAFDIGKLRQVISETDSLKENQAESAIPADLRNHQETPLWGIGSRDPASATSRSAQVSAPRRTIRSKVLFQRPLHILADLRASGSISEVVC